MSFLKTLGKLAGGAGGFVLSGGNPAGAMAGYAGASALMGGEKPRANTAADQYGTATTTTGANAADDRNRFLGALDGGQEALDKSTAAAVSSGMPAFNQNLQNIRDSAERRGVSNGEIETNSEGTLASAFQRNIANATASQATTLQGQKVNALGQVNAQDSNNYLDLLSGKLDRDQQERNRKQSFWNSIVGAAGGAAGAYFGSR